MAIAGVLIFGGGEAHTISGDLTLIDDDMSSLSPGDRCSGSGGYDDMQPGTQVVIEDGEVALWRLRNWSQVSSTE